jgi:hypothetical protein
MQQYYATVDTECIGNALKDSASTPVFQFDIEKLAKEGVEDFLPGSK